MCPAGRCKSRDKAVHKCQRSLESAESTHAVCRIIFVTSPGISRRLILLQLAVAKGRASLAVPYFFIILVCHLYIIIRGIGAVMESDNVDRII